MTDKHSPHKKERNSSIKTPPSNKANDRALKRKLFPVANSEPEKTNSKPTPQKRRRPVSQPGSPTVLGTPGRPVPLSERQQLALVLAMTKEDNNAVDSTSKHFTAVGVQAQSKHQVPVSVSSKKANKRNERGETPLHLAAIRGDVEMTKNLIKQGAEVNIQDFAAWTPLHEACNHGSYEVARVLLKAGAYVNTQGLEDDTPLHDAAINGHVKLVELLLRHGANPLQRNRRGSSPLDIANIPEIIALLKNEIIESGSDISTPEVRSPTSPESLASSDEQDQVKEQHGILNERAVKPTVHSTSTDKVVTLQWSTTCKQEKNSTILDIPRQLSKVNDRDTPNSLLSCSSDSDLFDPGLNLNTCINSKQRVETNNLNSKQRVETNNFNNLKDTEKKATQDTNRVQEDRKSVNETRKIKSDLVISEANSLISDDDSNSAVEIKPEDNKTVDSTTSNQNKDSEVKHDLPSPNRTSNCEEHPLLSSSSVLAVTSSESCVSSSRIVSPDMELKSDLRGENKENITLGMSNDLSEHRTYTDHSDTERMLEITNSHQTDYEFPLNSLSEKHVSSIEDKKTLLHEQVDVCAISETLTSADSISGEFVAHSSPVGEQERRDSSTSPTSVASSGSKELPNSSKHHHKKHKDKHKKKRHKDHSHSSHKGGQVKEKKETEKEETTKIREETPTGNIPQATMDVDDRQGTAVKQPKQVNETPREYYIVTSPTNSNDAGEIKSLLLKIRGTGSHKHKDVSNSGSSGESGKNTDSEETYGPCDQSESTISLTNCESNDNEKDNNRKTENNRETSSSGSHGKNSPKPEEEKVHKPTRSLRSNTSHINNNDTDNVDKEPMVNQPMTRSRKSQHDNNPLESNQIESFPRKRKIARPRPMQDESIIPSPPLHPTQHERFLNSMKLYVNIRERIAARQSQLFSVQPKLRAPNAYHEYLMHRKSYLLQTSPKSKVNTVVPQLSAPDDLYDVMKVTFLEQEKERHRLRTRHCIEREKLMLAVEQDIVRVHGRAARAGANQTIPYSACSFLKDLEIYNMPDTVVQEDNKSSIRARFNGRQFISWLQDVDAKYERIKEDLLRRHEHEASSLHAIQKLEWETRLQDMQQWDVKNPPTINRTHVPVVLVDRDFDLLPA